MTKLPIQPQDKYVLRLPDGMRDEIKAAADANGRSMNAEIINRLSESLAKATLGDGERRDYERRILVALDNEARLKDTLTRAFAALDKEDIQKAKELLIAGAWFEPQLEAPESTAADEDH